MKLTQVFIAASAMTLFALSLSCGTSDREGWRLIWSDEFDRTGSPDLSKWSFDVGGTGWGNNELQYYTNNDPQNVHIESGNLVITAKKTFDQLEPGTFGFYKDYTSTRIHTRDAFATKYGRVEVRAMLPEGRGLWPAIWMLPLKNTYGEWPSSGEIDIMEFVGFDPTAIHQTIHTRAYNHLEGTQKSQKTSLTDLPGKFHTYAIDWDAQEIKFYIDDVQKFSFKNDHISDAEWPFDQDFYLILNLAVGGNWGGMEGIDESIFPQSFKIDYVRIYSPSKP